MNPSCVSASFPPPPGPTMSAPVPTTSFPDASAAPSSAVTKPSTAGMNPGPDPAGRRRLADPDAAPSLFAQLLPQPRQHLAQTFRERAGERRTSRLEVSAAAEGLGHRGDLEGRVAA